MINWFKLFLAVINCFNCKVPRPIFDHCLAKILCLSSALPFFGCRSIASVAAALFWTRSIASDTNFCWRPSHKLLDSTTIVKAFGHCRDLRHKLCPKQCCGPETILRGPKGPFKKSVNYFKTFLKLLSIVFNRLKLFWIVF